MKTFKNIDLLAAAMASNEIPKGCISPGAAAAMMGISRSAVSQRIRESGSLEAWGADGVVLISIRSIKAAMKKKQGISDSQINFIDEIDEYEDPTPAQLLSEKLATEKMHTEVAKAEAHG